MIKKIVVLGIVLIATLFISGCTEPIDNTPIEVTDPADNITSEAISSILNDSAMDNLTNEVVEMNMTVENLTDLEVLELENMS